MVVVVVVFVVVVGGVVVFEFLLRMEGESFCCLFAIVGLDCWVLVE